MAVGPMPAPTAAPPAVVLDEVTYGIGAVVHVEQRALRALEQHALAAAAARGAPGSPVSAASGRSRGASRSSSAACSS